MSQLAAITDLETGGLDPAENPILQIALFIPVLPSHPHGFLAWQMKVLPPESSTGPRIITPEAVAKNGYDAAQWITEGAVELSTAITFYRGLLDAFFLEHPDAILISHNAGFERAFLDRAHKSIGREPIDRTRWRCCQELFKQAMDDGLVPPGSSSLDRLGQIVGQWGEGERGTHDALKDCIATAHGYRYLKALRNNTHPLKNAPRS